MSISILQNHKLFCESEAKELMLVLKECNMDTSLEKFCNFYKEEINKAQPEIMVYGIYNSGKSTLINALARKNVAAVGDVPLTDKIDKYVWNGYEITDTPGVDAPMKHQEVTEEHLKRCAVVIFVMSSGGGFENKSNYARMVDVIKAGKRLLIVVNDKSGIGDKLAIVSDIQWKVKRNLQVVGKECGVEIGDDDYEVIFVDAKLACEGHEYADEDVVINSNLPMLERRILTELKRVDGYAAARVIVNEIDRVAHDALVALSVQGTDDAVILNHLKAFLKENKQKVKEKIDSRIDREYDSLKKQLAACIDNNSEDQAAIQKGVDNVAQGHFEKIVDILKKQLNETIDEMQTTFEKKLNNICELVYDEKPNVSNGPVDMSGYSVDDPNFMSGEKTLDEKIREVLQDGGTLLGSYPNAKINSKLAEEATKKFLTSGPVIKLLTKAGLEKYVASAIPVIGQVVMVVSIVKDVISFFGSRERRRQEEELQRVAMENAKEEARAEMEKQRKLEIQRIAGDIASDILEQSKYVMFDSINKFFADIIDKVLAETRAAEVEADEHNKHVNKLHEIGSKCKEFCLLVQ